MSEMSGCRFGRDRHGICPLAYRNLHQAVTVIVAGPN